MRICSHGVQHWLSHPPNKQTWPHWTLKIRDSEEAARLDAHWNDDVCETESERLHAWEALGRKLSREGNKITRGDRHRPRRKHRRGMPLISLSSGLNRQPRSVKCVQDYRGVHCDYYALTHYDMRSDASMF